MIAGRCTGCGVQTTTNTALARPRKLMKLKAKRATASCRSHPAVRVRPVAAASLLWVALTACQYDGPPIPLPPPPGPATIGSTQDGTGRIDPLPDATQSGPPLSPAYLDCQRTAQFARQDFIRTCSKSQSPAGCRTEAAIAYRERMKHCAILL